MSTSTELQTPSTASDVLPIAKNGWKKSETEIIGYEMLGGKSGANAKYTNPNGTQFKVVALQMAPDFSAEQKAKEWACIGWDVGVSYREYAFAAGTGTIQQEYTPETPPHMTRSPISGSKSQSKELLTYSPILTEKIIADNQATCGN